jgi:hypothetical protein
MSVCDLQFLMRCALTLNDNVPGLDGDLDPLGDCEKFLRVAVALLSVNVLEIPCFASCAVGLGLGGVH